MCLIFYFFFVCVFFIFREIVDYIFWFFGRIFGFFVCLLWFLLIMVFVCCVLGILLLSVFNRISCYR